MRAFLKFNKGILRMPLPWRLWMLLLVALNLVLPLFFIDRLEAQLVLVAMAVVSLTGALVMGTVAGLIATLWLFPFMAFGAFIAVAYNLGLWQDRFHSDFWFAFAWGAFPALTSYWIHSLTLNATVILLALACFTLSLAQRTLSTQVRTIRRRTLNVAGTMEMTDGTIVKIDSSDMILAAERALLLLSITIVVFAGSLLAYRLLNT